MCVPSNALSKNLKTAILCPVRLRSFRVRLNGASKDGDCLSLLSNPSFCQCASLCHTCNSSAQIIGPCLSNNQSQIEQLLDLSHGFIRVVDRMSNGPRIGVDLVVVSSYIRLVAEEVDGGVLDAAGLLGFVLEVREAVRLVPALGEDVEGDLAADGVAIAVS